MQPASPIRYSLCSNTPLAHSADSIAGVRQRRAGFDNYDVVKAAHAPREVPRSAQLVLDFWNWVSRKLYLAAGCFIYCLREGFDAVNGFSEAVYASEEIWLSRDMRAWGKKNNMNFCIIEKNPILTSIRKLDWYTPGKLVLYSLPILIFPPLLRVQYFCSQWYRRPENVKSLSPRRRGSS